MNDIRQIAFTNELRLARPREQVFEAFIQSEKWFQVSYGEERLQRIVLERRVGGQIFEDWGDGAGVLYGTIGWWDPPAGYATVELDAGRRDHAQSPLRVRGGRRRDGAPASLQRLRPDLGRDGRGNPVARLARRPSRSSCAPGSSAAR